MLIRRIYFLGILCAIIRQEIDWRWYTSGMEDVEASRMEHYIDITLNHLHQMLPLLLLLVIQLMVLMHCSGQDIDIFIW